jgi:protein SCO1/2
MKFTSVFAVLPQAGSHLLAGVLAAAMLFATCVPSGAQPSAPPEGASISFTLTAGDGGAVSERTYRGKWLIVYFGYTFCPDICPTTLIEMAGALEKLGPRAETVQGLFITVDPKRDTPEVLNEYVTSFDPRIVGLTGSPTQIGMAAKSFNVFYERRDTDDGGYVYDHATLIYLIDPDGRFRKAIAGNAGAQQIADTLATVMKAKP